MPSPRARLIRHPADERVCRAQAMSRHYLRTRLARTTRATRLQCHTHSFTSITTRAQRLAHSLSSSVVRVGGHRMSPLYAACVAVCTPPSTHASCVQPTPSLVSELGNSTHQLKKQVLKRPLRPSVAGSCHSSCSHKSCSPACSQLLACWEWPSCGAPIAASYRHGRSP